MAEARWIMGGPDDTAGRSPCLLREVAPGLLVGSALAAPYVDASCAVVRCSEHCAGAGHASVLTELFEDRTAVAPDVFERVIAFARACRSTRPVLFQCYAGLSRSATLAYVVLRVVDGLDHNDALRRVAHAVEHYDRTMRWPHPVTLASARAWCDERANATAASDPHREIARLTAMRADGAARAWRRALDSICEDCMRHRSVCICGPLEQEAPLG